MCGIVGARGDWLRSRGLEPAAAIRAAVASMRWRGADGEGSVPAGGWWLGCARLAISGEHGAQPVVRRGGRFAGVLNGAVTNARDLWRRLAPGVERRRQLPNDAWLPLLAAERGDVRSLADLAGHHAYAVVDAQTDALQLGQDRYGEKPLYCVTTQHGDRKRLVAFASTLGALRHLGVEVPLHIVDAASWFRYGWAPDGPGWITDAVRVGSLPERGRPWTFGPEREVCWQGLDSDAAPRREAVARAEEAACAITCTKPSRGASTRRPGSACRCPAGSTAAVSRCCSASCSPARLRSTSAPRASPATSAAPLAK